MNLWLFWIGFLLVVVGLALSLRAIYIVTAKRGLDAAWLRGLRRTQEVARQIGDRLARQPTTIEIRPEGIPSGEAVGTLTVTGSAAGTSGPLTLEMRIEALERGVRQVQEAVVSRTNDLSSRIELLRADSEASAAAIDERITVAEQEADKIDACSQLGNAGRGVYRARHSGPSTLNAYVANARRTCSFGSQ